MDSQYLKDNVGPALAKGLAATSLTRPQDPIEYLANWLIKYVDNQKRDQQIQKDAVLLEEQRRQHLESLEHHRLRLEEDKRRAEEETKRLAQEKIQKRLDQVRRFEDAKEHKDQEISAFLSSTKEEDVKKRRTDLTYQIRNKWSLLGQLLHDTPKDEFVGLANSNPSSAELDVLKAVLTILGLGSKLKKWTNVKNALKKHDVRKLIGEFSPIKAQSRKKFFIVPALLQRINKPDIYETQSPVIYILLLEWVEQSLEYRNEVMNLRSQKLGEDRRAEPVIDPDTIEDDDDDDDKEQDDLTEYTIGEEVVEEPDTSEEADTTATEPEEEESAPEDTEDSN